MEKKKERGNEEKKGRVLEVEGWIWVHLIGVHLKTEDSVS